MAVTMYYEDDVEVSALAGSVNHKKHPYGAMHRKGVFVCVCLCALRNH